MAARQCQSCGGAPGGDAAAPLLRRSVNITECVSVPSSEHVAEIVGRQGCKIKALRAKTNTYIKTPMRGEEPVFVVTGHKEDVAAARREILLAAEHFSLLRASTGREAAAGGPSTVRVPVRVPYHLVGLVVGPRGTTVKRIQQRTGTCILSPSRDMEPVFEVTGTPENVDRAREEIEMHIALRTGTFLELGDGAEGGSESGPARAWPDSGGSLGRGSKDSGFGALWAGEAPGAAEEPLPDSPAYEPLPVPSPTPWAPLEPVGAPAGPPRLGSRPPTPRVSPAPAAGAEPVWGRRARSIDLGWPQRGPPAFSPGTGSYSSSNGGSNSSSPPESRRRSDCLLCLDGEAAATLLPCGHNLFCAICARGICGRAVPACPVCQAAVTHAI